MATSTLQVKNVAKLQAVLTPSKMKPKLERNIRIATGRNALLVQKEIRKKIQAGDYHANAPLTVAIKGSDKALVDKGDLFGSITKTMVDERTAFVGILKTDQSYNIGLTLHEGAMIKVTKRMRGMFFLLWLASIGRIPPGDLTGRAAELFDRFKRWKPLSPSTTVIRISPRRFIASAFEQPTLKRKLTVNWKNAVRQTWVEGQQ